jgi:hypothetical protein
VTVGLLLASVQVVWAVCVLALCPAEFDVAVLSCVACASRELDIPLRIRSEIVSSFSSSVAVGVCVGRAGLLGAGLGGDRFHLLNSDYMPKGK